MPAEPTTRRAPIYDAIVPTVVCSWRQSPACMPIIAVGDPIKVHSGICPACAEHMRVEMESNIDQITR